MGEFAVLCGWKVVFLLAFAVGRVLYIFEFPHSEMEIGQTNVRDQRLHANKLIVLTWYRVSSK